MTSEKSLPLIAWARNAVDGSLLKYLVVTGLLIITFPGDFQAIKPGLDHSWEYAVNYLTQTDFVFGREVSHTVGPLGYLLHPLNIDRICYMQLIFDFSSTVYLRSASSSTLQDKKRAPHRCVCGWLHNFPGCRNQTRILIPFTHSAIAAFLHFNALQGGLVARSPSLRSARRGNAVSEVWKSDSPQARFFFWQREFGFSRIGRKRGKCLLWSVLPICPSWLYLQRSISNPLIISCSMLSGRSIWAMDSLSLKV